MKTILSFLSLALLINAPLVNATTPLPYNTSPLTGTVQGGSDSSFAWLAPFSKSYKVQVYVGMDGTATNALYRVYPKGKALNSNVCSSTNKTYPCFEIPVNQAQNQGKWVQLAFDNNTNNAKSVWQFDITKKGFVSVSTNNLRASENLSINGNVRFVPTTAYPTIGYSKIANDGTLLRNSVALGTAAKSWACTRDNVSALFWEVKTSHGGVHDMNNTFTWYDPNSATNAGYAGYRNGGTCLGGISCDSYAYIQQLNSEKYCGFNDWRLPTKSELANLVNKKYSPTISPTFFPNTIAKNYWTSSFIINNSGASSMIDFSSGNETVGNKSTAYGIRLVRGGH